MYKDGSRYKQSIENWENERLLFEQKNKNKDGNLMVNWNTNKNDLCWFKMDHFKSQILDIDVGNIDDGTGVNLDKDWSNIKEQYLENNFNIECDEITKNNSLIRKMGNICQIICLLGSEQSVFGENVLHLTGLWLDNFNKDNGDGDRILVCGKNSLLMNGLKDIKNNIDAYLVHEESWDLYQQYSLNKDTIYVAGMCNTEQRIQSYQAQKLNIPNVPSYVRLRTQIQMTLVKQQS